MQKSQKSTTTGTAGTLLQLAHTSKVLKNNPLGDPHQRTLPVYLPPGYDAHPTKHYPLIFELAGFTGSGLGRIAWKNFEENVPQRLDRLINSNKMPPCIVAFPDCFTALGGNQYINSTAIGKYADYINKELVPFVDHNLRTKSNHRHRAVVGKSSGGYGAMMFGMNYPEVWGAVGNHSGDAYFDFVYKSEWPAVITYLQNFKKTKSATPIKTIQANPGIDDGRIQNFLNHFKQANPSGMDIMTLMMLCMAATYDPHPRSKLGFRIPFDLNTGELLEKRWQQWLTHDPINLSKQQAKNLSKLRGLYIDCGWRDQFHIHFGTRQLSQVLKRHKVSHRYEEFEGTHSGIDYRLDTSLPFLARKIR